MRIFHLLPKLHWGGAEQHTAALALAQTRLGHAVFVLSAGGPNADRLAKEGVTLVEFPFRSRWVFTIPMRRRALGRLLVAQRPDVVHAHSRIPAWIGAGACRDIGLPFVTTVHGAHRLGGFGLKRLYNSSMGMGARVIVPSGPIERHMREVYGVSEDRLVRIPVGIDVEAFNPDAVDRVRIKAVRSHWGIEAGHRVLIVPGRVTRTKGQSIALEVFARAGLDDFVCIFAGDPERHSGVTERLQEQAAALGVAKRVRFVGHVDDMPAAYAAADIALFSGGSGETFGRAAIEAVAMGCPVVIPMQDLYLETLPEICDEWRVASGDVDAFGAALRRIACDPTARGNARLAIARERIRELYGIDQCARRTVAVYHELLPTTTPAQGNPQ